MIVRLLSTALILAVVFATPSAGQNVKNAPKSKAAAPQASLGEFETQYRDKGWSKEIVGVFFAIKVDRTIYDRVQARHGHTDQRLIKAARDTKELGLTGRQNFEDLSNSTASEIAALRKHAQGAKAGSRK